MKEDVRLYCGKEVQFRIVGMTDSVRGRFLRAKWKLADLEGRREDGADVLYPSLERAVLDRDGVIDDVILDEKHMTDEKIV